MRPFSRQHDHIADGQRQIKKNIKKLKNIYRVLWSFGPLQGRLTFIVKEESLHWSEVFTKIQSLQKQYKHFVTDITVNETSLEEIFLQFANTKAQQSHDGLGVEAISV